MGTTQWLRLASGRLRDQWPWVAEATLAASVAWLVDTRLVGHQQPFFAPAAALIVLGQARGLRMRRAVEVVLGVAGGVLVADVVAQALGPHTTVTIFTVILMTLTLAVAVGAGPVFTVQAAVSALYVAVVAPPTGAAVPSRFVDALIGGGVALVASQLAVARDPVAQLARETRQTFAEVASVLEEIAAALAAQNESAAVAALQRARQSDAAVDRLETAVLAAGEALRFHVRRRQRLGGVNAVESAVRQVDYVVRNVRVLARAGVTLLRLKVAPPPELAVALRQLAAAVRAVDDAFAAELGDPAHDARRRFQQAEETALDAVRTAGQLLPEGPPLALVMIVGQVRATVIDLLRGAGADDAEVLGRVDAALGLPPV
ncbi:MAG: FUSC family protein [Actinomycetes bacterium]